jgi:anti-anti-sigma factor
MASLQGELTFASVPALLQQAPGLIADGRLDLSKVSNADSAGLALLLELTRRAKAKGGDLRLASAPPQVRDLIRFFDLETALKLDSAA